MADRSLFCVMTTCHNDRIYLQNQLPQLLEVADKIVIVDDFSSDGTLEYVEGLNNSKVEFYQRQFDCCAKQFDFALQKLPKGNVWVLNMTAIELPTNYFFENIRNVLDESDKRDIDRIWMSVFHLRGERTMCQETGGELRLFRNGVENENKFSGYPHECIDGKYYGYGLPEVDREFAFVRFRQASKEKIREWLEDYVEKGIYSLWDLKRRLDYPTVELPMFINYKINDELRKHLGWTN